MSKHNFIIWLRGFIDLVGRQPTWSEWEIIKDHIKLVHDGIPGEPMYLGHESVFNSGKPLTELSGAASMVTC